MKNLLLSLINMVITNKSIVYNEVLQLTDDEEILKQYRIIYRKTTYEFWKKEYFYFVKRHIQKRHIAKVLTYRLPIEIYFKISSYLNNFKN